MMPNKVCPKCANAVNIRRLFCDCGHVFVLRRTKRISMKSRKLEQQALLTKLTSEQKASLQKVNTERKAAKRAHVGIMKLIIKSRQLIIE